MSIKIIKKGIAGNLQNAGTYGLQHLGIQTGGYLDFLSAQLANKIVGNVLNEAVLEIYFPSNQFEFEESLFITITGANFIPVLNQKSIPMHTLIEVNKGDILQFLQPMQGRVAYVAFSKKGVGQIKPKMELIETIEQFLFTSTPVRFIPGPAWKDLNTPSIEKLLGQPFRISMQSNRMGFPLDGPSLSTTIQKSYISSAVTRGTMQLLPNGQIIVLMADHQTIGGYPNIGQIILVDLPRLAQTQHRMPIHFRLCNVSTAHEQYQFIQTSFAD